MLLLLLLAPPWVVLSLSYTMDERGLQQPEHQDTQWLESWPCPPAEEVAPCSCGQAGGNPSKLEMLCDGVVDLQEIERVFAVQFPFNNLHSIALSVNDYNIWENSTAVTLPPNVFKDKTAKRIWISIKVSEVDPLAFENTSDMLEDLSISGPGWVDGKNPLDDFPLYILESFPNLKRFMLQGTMIADKMFDHHENLTPVFSELSLPNLG